MTLSLDHQGRVNLSALVGMLECRSVSETRMAWRLMDKFILNEDEKRQIDFVTQTVNGNEIPSWNPAKSLPPVEFELTEAEWAQVQKALTGTRFVPGPMRGWLEPILAKIPEPVESNGGGHQ